MGGGGESAENCFPGDERLIYVGHDPVNLEEMRFKIANPTASLYNNRTQILAALEFACLDIIGKKWGVPVYDILGGKLQDEVPFASYLFFRYPNSKDGSGEVRTVDQLVAHAKELKAKHGFYAHKLKGGVFDPFTNLNVIGLLPPNSGPIHAAAIHFDLIRMRLGQPSRRSGSGSRLRISTTITSKTRFTACTECVGLARRCECL